MICSPSPCLVLYQQQRGMANLKAIAIRLKSVKNIQKITQSMKMVSAAKYSRAERDLKAARPYGEGARAFLILLIALTVRIGSTLIVSPSFG